MDYVILIRRGKDGGYYNQESHWIPVRRDKATRMTKENADEMAKELLDYGYRPVVEEIGKECAV